MKGKLSRQVREQAGGERERCRTSDAQLGARVRIASRVGLQEESMIQVVTFSGVTSGGMVTSGTTCCTCRIDDAHCISSGGR